MDEVRTAVRRLRALDEATLESICATHHVRVLTLFGSSTDPQVETPSDIDIGVIFEPGANRDLVGLIDTLARLLQTDRVDLLDAAHASDTARMRAVGEGTPLFESERGAYAWAAAAAQSLYLEMSWMREAAVAPR